MLKLFELAHEYLRILDACDHAGDPESERAFADTIAGIKGEIDHKIDNCSAVVRTMEAEMKALQEEEERMYARRKAIDANKERLKAYMQTQMELCGLDKSKGARFSVMIQKNPPKVAVDEESKLPDAYWVTKREPNKRDILAAFKSGQVVPGCRLEESSSLRIR